MVLISIFYSLIFFFSLTFHNRGLDCIIDFFFFKLYFSNLVCVFQNNIFFIFILILKHFREEVLVTTSDSFLITIPREQIEDDCEEEIIDCVSGSTLSSVVSNDGCEVNYCLCYSGGGRKAELIFKFFSSYIAKTKLLSPVPAHT